MSITADVTIDCRNAVGFESMHNFTVSKILTYSGMLGKTDVKRVIELYDKMLDSAKDGVKDEAERTINSLKPLVNLHPRILADIVSLVVSKAVKGQRSDFSYTNLGNLNLPDGVKKQLSSLEFYSIPESADAAISMLEFGDEAIITITENYVDEMIISDFVGIAKILGINFIVQESESFKQSRLKL